MKKIYLYILFFSITGYSQNISITKEWGTYDVGYYSSATDENGNIYFSGSAGIQKFSSLGELLWFVSAPSPYDIKIDNDGNIVICGYTGFGGTSISTEGAFQEDFGGIQDAFLMKLTPEGDVIWCTYFGGAEDDFNETNNSLGSAYNSRVAITPQNDIVWLCHTGSENMATSGTFQTERNGTNYILSKFTTTGQREWSTYYGTSDVRATINGLQVDGANIYISGVFKNYPVNNPNTYFDTFNDYTYQYNNDAVFISKFDYTGNRVWSRCLTGNGSDVSYRNTLALSNNKLYLSFATNSTNLGTAGTYKPDFGGVSPGFLAQFDVNGTKQWGTYLPETTLFGINTPSVYTNSTAGVFVVGSTIVDVTVGLDFVVPANLNTFDPYIMKIDEQGQREWGIYCGGGNGNEYILYGMAFHPIGFYIYGTTEGSTDIATPGAYQEINEYEDNFNGFVVKYRASDLKAEAFTVDSFSAYPNPAVDEVFVSINENVALPLQINLYNTLGQQLKTYSVTEKNTAIFIKDLSSGIYFLQLSSNGQNASKKIIVR